MAKGKLISAIDLGSEKTTTLIAQMGSELDTPQATSSFREPLNIVGVSSVPSKGIKKGQIVNIDEAVESAIVSIEAAERMAGYNLDNAYVSLGGASIMSQNSQGVVAVSDPQGEINDSDINRVIEAASAVSLPLSKELIHVIPMEYTVDGEGGVKDPIGMSGVRLELQTHLITASAASVKNLRKAINEMGVNINQVVFTGLAASKAVLTDTEKELGCVLVEIGGGTTSVIAFSEGSVVYSGVVPIGAKNITNDLAIGLRVSLDTAEKLKLMISKDSKKVESASDVLDLTNTEIKELKKVSKKTIAEGIIRPRLNEIFTIVRIELEKAGIATRIPSGVILSGGGAMTVGSMDSAKRSLSLPVRVGKPQGVSGLIDDILNPAFSVPIGLILYGTEDMPNESFSSIKTKIKLPKIGVAGKLIDAIKDILP